MAPIQDTSADSKPDYSSHLPGKFSLFHQFAPPAHSDPTRRIWNDETNGWIDEMSDFQGVPAVAILLPKARKWVRHSTAMATGRSEDPERGNTFELETHVSEGTNQVTSGIEIRLTAGHVTHCTETLEPLRPRAV